MPAVPELHERPANMASVAGHGPPQGTWRRRLAVGLLTLFGAGYLIQVVTPLRVNVDSLTYLMMSISAMGGEGFLDRGDSAQFPPGYPALLAALGLMGLGTPFWIVLVNVVAVGLGCWAAYGALTASGLLPKRQALWVVVATLASFAVIKHVTLPMAESVFFFLVMLFGWTCVIAIRQSAVWEQLFWGGLCALLAVTAFLTRSAGVVLLVPLAMLPLLGRNVGGRARLFITHHPIRTTLLIIAVLAAVAVVWWWIRGTVYYADIYRLLQDWGMGSYLQLSFLLTLQELGEIGLNGPAGRMIAQVPIAEVVIRVLGGILLSLSIIGVMTRRRSWGPVDVLFGAYVALMLVWLSVDARFWIPVLPLLLAFAWLGIERLVPRLAGPLVTLYLVCFLVMGAFAIGYSTRLSLMSPQDFTLHYGDHSFIPGYEAALGGGERENLEGMNRRVYDALIHFGRSDQVILPDEPTFTPYDSGLD